MEQPKDCDQENNLPNNRQFRMESVDQRIKTEQEKDQYDHMMTKSPIRSRFDEENENYQYSAKNKANNLDQVGHIDSDEERGFNYNPNEQIGITYNQDEEIDREYAQNDDRIQELDTPQMKFYNNTLAKPLNDSENSSNEVEFARPNVEMQNEQREEMPKEKKVYIEIENFEKNPSFGAHQYNFNQKIEQAGFNFETEIVSNTITSGQKNNMQHKDTWDNIENNLENRKVDSPKNKEKTRNISQKYKEMMLTNFDKINKNKESVNNVNVELEQDMVNYDSMNLDSQINESDQIKIGLKDTLEDINKIKNQIFNQKNDSDMFQEANMGFKATSKQRLLGGIEDLDVKAYFATSKSTNNLVLTSSNFENNSTNSDYIDLQKSLEMNQNVFKKNVQRNDNLFTTGPCKSLKLLNLSTKAPKKNLNEDLYSSNVLQNLNKILVAQKSQSPQRKLSHFSNSNQNTNQESNVILHKKGSFLKTENIDQGGNLFRNQLQTSQALSNSIAFSTASLSQYGADTLDASKCNFSRKNDQNRRRKSPFNNNKKGLTTRNSIKKARNAKSPSFVDNVKFSVIPRGNMNDFPESNQSPSKGTELKGQNLRKHFKNWLDNLDDELSHKTCQQTSPDRYNISKSKVLSPYKPHNQKEQWKNFNKNLNKPSKAQEDDNDSDSDDLASAYLKNIDKNKQLRLEIMEINKRYHNIEGVNPNEKRVNEIMDDLNRRERHSNNHGIHKMNNREQKEYEEVRQDLISFTNKGLGMTAMVMKLKRDNYTFFV